MSYFQLLWDQIAEINNVLNLRQLSIPLSQTKFMWHANVGRGNFTECWFVNISFSMKRRRKNLSLKEEKQWNKPQAPSAQGMATSERTCGLSALKNVLALGQSCCFFSASCCVYRNSILYHLCKQDCIKGTPCLIFPPSGNNP